jgi:2-polyprenyl-6-methoxyphenol hydroxylase-like FAD-dependent oxidoreductase
VNRSDVLIAGAGPTGLILALWLTRLGVSVRIVDKVGEPGTTSRALGVQARTLELYAQVGLADALIERGQPFVAANLWVKGKRVARVPFGTMGEGISRYPYMLIFPQDEHERLLIDRLSRLGVTIERPVELTGFEDRGERIVATLRASDGSEESCEAGYLVGCDGARSRVREVLKTGFPGSTYTHLFYVADAIGSGPVMNHELHVALDLSDFMAVFPMKGNGHARLIGTVKDTAADAGRPLEWSDVSRTVLTRLDIAIERINWFSTYHVHHRLAAHFRAGRAFLAGDSGHIHSPVGAQGMNTGLGDAINLAWKLAAVLQHRASERLLDTYEPERITFAQRLVATTDRAFQIVTSETPSARFVRTRIVPRLMPFVFSFRAMQRFMFRTISQTAIRYRESALSSGVVGKVAAGDRLPWIAPDGGGSDNDNYTPLRSLDWQVHVYGAATPAVAEASAKGDFALHAFAWRDAMGAAGLARDAAYFIRPDGYVGWAGAEAGAMAQYIETWSLRPRARRTMGNA